MSNRDRERSTRVKVIAARQGGWFVQVVARGRGIWITRAWTQRQLRRALERAAVQRGRYVETGEEPRHAP